MAIGKYTATTAQTLTLQAPAITWQNDEIKGGCPIYHKPGTGRVEVAGGCRCHPVPYSLNVHINASGVAGQVQFGIFQDGEELPTARMSYYAAGTGNIISVDSSTIIAAGCKCSTISVRTLTAGVSVESAELTVKTVKEG